MIGRHSRRSHATGADRPPIISVMLAVEDAVVATGWYREALGAVELWNLGSVVGLSVQGAPLFLGQPEGRDWGSPSRVGTRTVRIEVFVDDPDRFIARAVAAGADGSADEILDHEAPWGAHRQGGFLDPFGHLWLVGDRSPWRLIRPPGLIETPASSGSHHRAIPDAAAPTAR